MKKQNIKIKILISVIALLNVIQMYAQNDIHIALTKTVNPITYTLTPNQQISPSANLNIIFDGTNPSTDTYTVTYLNNLGAAIPLSTVAAGVYTISAADLTALANAPNPLTFTAAVNSGTNSVTFTQTVAFSSPTSTNNPPGPPLKSRVDIIRQFRSKRTFSNPYENKKDLVHLYFDVNGKLLNSLPVNVDQNDKFIFYIVSQQGYEDMYSIKVVEGDYAPSDLSIRPYTPLTGTNISTQSNQGAAALSYTYTMIKIGPFTSDNFEFQIAFDDTTKKIITHSDPYSIKINKLFHVGIGVSLISTNLSNPEYKIFNTGTDTVIKDYKGGSRTLITLNAIWYWSVFQQNPRGSVITNGRDILKDEPTFTLKRVFPTVGVSIDKDFRNNLFAGFVYEFARGGSLIAGVHYGKVRVLADKRIVINETPFHGTDNDIKIDEVYKPGFFFGINLDTRILNALFGAK